MKTLNEIADEIRAHTGCDSEPCRTATNAVPGEGNPNADIMFVGEGPGKNEDLQGRPFVGAAGKLLDELLASIDLKREDVFIGNILKFRPPGNRDPRPDEVAHNWPWLKEQVEAINPKLIVLLGRHAMDTFLPDCKISVDHGRAKRYRGQVYYPVYHPAAALYTGSLKETLLEDFKKIPQLLEKIGDDTSDKLEIEPALAAQAADQSPAVQAEPAPTTETTQSTTNSETAKPAAGQQPGLF